MVALGMCSNHKREPIKSMIVNKCSKFVKFGNITPIISKPLPTNCRVFLNLFLL